MCILLHTLLFRMAASTQCLVDACCSSCDISSPSEPCSLILQLFGFIDELDSLPLSPQVSAALPQTGASSLLSVLPSALSQPLVRFSASSLTTDSFTVSDFESFQSSSRSSMQFSPPAGSVLVLPAVGYALSVLLIFTCCWECSARGPRTRVAFFLLHTTGSLSASSGVTLW